MLYTGPFKITKSSTVSAYATNGSVNSDVVTWTYSLPYAQQEDVVFSVSADMPLTKVDYFVDGEYVGSGTTGPNYNFVLSSLKTIKEYSIKAIGYTQACISDPMYSTMLVTEPPFLQFSNIKNGENIQQAPMTLNLVSYALSLGEVSAVNVSSNYGNLGNATKIDNIHWTIPFNVGPYSNCYLSAYSIDTLGIYNTTTINVNVLIKPTISTTINGLVSPTLSANTIGIFSTTASSNTAGTISSVELFYEDVKLADCIYDGSRYISSYPINSFGSGLKTFTIKVIDSNGAIGYNDISVTVLPFVGTFTTPNIEVVSSVPESKVSSSTITSTIKISDYINGIALDTLKVINASKGTIKEVVPYKVYEFDIYVSNTLDVIIEVYNILGKSSSITISDYVIKCPECKKLNLTNYLPEFLRYGVGNQLEYFNFVEFFENTLNSLYDDIDGSCNISVMEKATRLRELHNIDKIEKSYLPYLAGMLDYDINLSREELDSYAYNQNGTYNDDTEAYVDKMLRFVVNNLPNTYNIKTTRNAIKILLLSFGIMGNVVEKYTNDYKDTWENNNYTSDIYVNSDITSDFYPTPHISIGIDIKNTPLELLTQPNNSIARMVDAIESIRPVNIVFDSVLGYVHDIKLPNHTINLKFCSTKVISIGKENQLPPFKA